MEDLLEFIVTELYGEVSAAVARCLLRHGDLTAFKLCNFTEMQFAEVRNALVAMIQQNIVGAIESDEVKYRLLKDEVMARLRFPKYVKLLKSLYKAGAIAEAVLENGSLTRAEITERLGDSSQGFQNRLSSLIEASILVPVGFVTPPVPSDKPQKRKATTSGMGALKKLKQDRVKVKAEVAAPTGPVGSSDTFYRLNFKLLDKRLMGELISGLVESRASHRAALLAEAMFILAEGRPAKVKEIQHHAAPQKFTAEEVQSLFDSELSVFVTAKPGETYALNVEMIMKVLKQKMAEAIVKQHFGENAGRVFLVLNAKGFMDERNLTELTLLPPRETQRCLNELFRAGILVTQEVTERDVYYGVRFKEVCIQFARNVLQGILNLKVRLEAELMEQCTVMKGTDSPKWSTYCEMETRTESALLELERMCIAVRVPSFLPPYRNSRFAARY